MTTARAAVGEAVAIARVFSDTFGGLIAATVFPWLLDNPRSAR